MEKALVTINGKEYELRFTIGFWKKIKEAAGVTSINLEKMLQEDFGVIAPQVVMWGIHYSSPLDVPSIQDIESQLDRSVLDAIEQAVINGMTKPEKELLELARKQRSTAIKSLEDGIGSAGEKK